VFSYRRKQYFTSTVEHSECR